MSESTIIPAFQNLEFCSTVHEITGNSRTFAEFFAGIGLTHLGLASHGWKCLYANDIEPKKKRMYESQFGTADYYQVEDVWNTQRITSKMPATRVDLATASFPCVDLSLAGNLKGFAGDQSGAFNGFAKVLATLKQEGRLPRAVLVENVIGFLTSHGGRFLRVALRALSNLGYYMDAIVVDAKHFVPQSRPRLFLIGFLDELKPTSGLGQVVSDAETGNWELREPLETRIRPAPLVQALKKSSLATGWIPLQLPPLPAENRSLAKYIDIDRREEWWDGLRVKKHLAEMHPTHRARVEELRNRGVTTVGTIYRRVREGKSRSEIRTDGLAGCLRTPRGGSSRQIVLVAGKGKIQMKWMTPREYARLQGCPDFPIDVDRNEALFGFGDAVCVPAIGWIAENVLTQLFLRRSRANELQQAAEN